MNHLPRISSLLVLLTMSCGDAGVPDAPASDARVPDAPVDAMPVDACSCQREPWSSRVAHDRYGVLFRFSMNGVLNECTAVPDFVPGTRLLGGGTVLEAGPNEERAWLSNMGLWWPDIISAPPPDEESSLRWVGMWLASVIDPDHRIIASIACLRPPTEGAPDQRQIQATRSTEFARIPPDNTLFDARASCRNGILVGGACSLNPLQDHYSKLVRAGFDPANPGQWLCSWSNEVRDSEEIEVAATAYCLEEDAESIPAEQSCCAPLEQSIVFRQTTKYVLPGANRMEVSCEPGELLLLGTCMLDGVDPVKLDGITLFRSGFPPTEEFPNGDPAYWGCSWYSAANVTPTAIATAVCLRPD